MTIPGPREPLSELQKQAGEVCIGCLSGAKAALEFGLPLYCHGCNAEMPVGEDGTPLATCAACGWNPGTHKCYTVDVHPHCGAKAQLRCAECRAKAPLKKFLWFKALEDFGMDEEQLEALRRRFRRDKR